MDELANAIGDGLCELLYKIGADSLAQSTCGDPTSTGYMAGLFAIFLLTGGGFFVFFSGD